MLHNIKHWLSEIGHKAHHVPEYAHVGYFATAAGVMHEYHAVLAAICGLLVLGSIIMGSLGD